MTPFYRINPRWTGIFQSRGEGCELFPEEGFRGLIGPSWVFQLGNSRQGLGGSEWWKNDATQWWRGMLNARLLDATQQETGAMSPIFFSAIFWLAGRHHCLESIGNNSCFDSLVFGWLAVAGGFKFRNLNNLREASRRHHQLRLWQIIQMSSCQIARKSDKA